MLSAKFLDESDDGRFGCSREEDTRELTVLASTPAGVMMAELALRVSSLLRVSWPLCCATSRATQPVLLWFSVIGSDPTTHKRRNTVPIWWRVVAL